MNAKEKILNNIRKALQTSVPLPFPEVAGPLQPFAQAEDDLAVVFAESFTSLAGKFAISTSRAEGIRQVRQLVEERGWKEVYCAEMAVRAGFTGAGFPAFSGKDLEHSDLSITTCEALVARTGSMVLSSAIPEGRTASVYAPVHICLATTDQLVFDIADALDLMHRKYGKELPSFLTFASGPSRTADIEKTLVTGVHGPGEVYCFLLDDPAGWADRTAV